MFNSQIMAASSIKLQFHESQLSNQQNREGRAAHAPHLNRYTRKQEYEI